jgi:hypothetical protein
MKYFLKKNILYIIFRFGFGFVGFGCGVGGQGVDWGVGGGGSYPCKAVIALVSNNISN